MDERKKLRSDIYVNKFNKKNTSLVDIPNIEEFQVSKLPLLKELIGIVLNRKDAKSLSYDDATVMVVKQLMEHWKSRNIYTKTRKNVTAELKKHVKEYRDLLKLPDTSKGKPLSRCQKFNGKADKLFDIFSSDENRR